MKQNSREVFYVFERSGYVGKQNEDKEEIINAMVPYRRKCSEKKTLKVNTKGMSEGMKAMLNL